ncbi:MAG TPA: sulfotransferase [Euzebyales bacterium]|nr:sulfotransferase [Euzebyales bacterium]
MSASRQRVGAELRPIIIVGCPRSGTTLLQLMLHSHPRIAIPPENRFVFPIYARRLRFGDLRLRRNRDRVATFIIKRRWMRLEHLGVEPDDLRRRMRQADPTIGSLLATVFEAYAARFDKPRWGDKRPAYIDRLDMVLRLFPDAQIIHIIRDGRDCVSSLKRMPWWRRSTYAAIRTWVDAIENGERARATLAPDQYTEVRYEDLIADPEPELRRLTTWLGEDFDPAMLEPHRVSRVAVPEGKTWHRNTRREVNASAVQRWASDLEPWELRLMEAVAGDRLRRYGYELSHGSRPAPPAVHLARYADEVLRRRLWSARRRRRDRIMERRYGWPVAAAASDRATADVS